jgi:hypothetical protein
MKNVMMTLGLLATLLVGSASLFAQHDHGCCGKDDMSCCKDGCCKK